MALKLPNRTQIKSLNLDPQADADQLADQLVELVIDINGGLDDPEVVVAEDFAKRHVAGMKARAV